MTEQAFDTERLMAKQRRLKAQPAQQYTNAELASAVRDTAVDVDNNTRRLSNITKIVDRLCRQESGRRRGA